MWSSKLVTPYTALATCASLARWSAFVSSLNTLTCPVVHLQPERHCSHGRVCSNSPLHRFGERDVTDVHSGFNGLYAFHRACDVDRALLLLLVLDLAADTGNAVLNGRHQASGCGVSSQLLLQHRLHRRVRPAKRTFDRRDKQVLPPLAKHTHSKPSERANFATHRCAAREHKGEILVGVVALIRDALTHALAGFANHSTRRVFGWEHLIRTDDQQHRYDGNADRFQLTNPNREHDTVNGVRSQREQRGVARGGHHGHAPAGATEKNHRVSAEGKHEQPGCKRALLELDPSSRRE